MYIHITYYGQNVTYLIQCNYFTWTKQFHQKGIMNMCKTGEIIFISKDKYVSFIEYIQQEFCEDKQITRHFNSVQFLFCCQTSNAFIKSKNIYQRTGQLYTLYAHLYKEDML